MTDFASKFSKLTPLVNTTEARIFRASFVDGVWYGKKGGIYTPILIPKNICNTIHYIFSSKTNGYWPEGTLKRHEKLNRSNYVEHDGWTPFRHGLMFRGTIIKGFIHVDWKDLQSKLEKEYGSTYNKSSTTKS